jgi:hypothetical protein
MPPFSAEVKIAWSCTSTVPYFFMVWCLVKQRDNFIVIIWQRWGKGFKTDLNRPPHRD